jgi:hypothetical protein
VFGIVRVTVGGAVAARPAPLARAAEYRQANEQRGTGGGAAMRDILDQGGDRESGPWPRRLAAIGALAVAAVLIGLYLPGHLSPSGRPVPGARPAQSGAGPGEAVGGQAPGAGQQITGITGTTLRWGRNVGLPVSGERPAWLFPATGRIKPIADLPPSGSGYQFIRVGDGWALQANLADNISCSHCDAAPLPVYFLGDQARSVTEVGQANLVAPGAATGELWLTSYPRGTDIPGGKGTAREVSTTGAPLGPQLTLPAGEAIEQATDRGLLLAPAAPRTGEMADMLWDPSDPQASRTFSGVIAASPAEIAWAPQCDQQGTSPCLVEVLNLLTGKLTTLPLPGAMSAASGVLSPDGQFLAIEASYYDMGSLAAQLYVATVTTGQLTPVPEASVSSDALVGFGWPTAGDSLVAELSFTTTVQVASWRPGAADLAVAAVRPGRDSATLVVS